MALRLISPTNGTRIVDIKVDVICVPAIGADPWITWRDRLKSVSGSGYQNARSAMQDRIPAARIYIYDHLTAGERNQKPKERDHLTTELAIQDYALTEDTLADYDVVDWADRFLDVLKRNWGSRGSQRGAMFFMCHSTGGNVVKQALCKKTVGEEKSALAMCLGVAFFATPHHGSIVLSQDEFAQSVQEKLNLKWEMSDYLRQDFSPENPELETRNAEFGIVATGMMVYSYIELHEIEFTVSTSSDDAEEAISDTASLHVVQSHSAIVERLDVSIENEEVIYLNTTHGGTARFEGENHQYELFLDKINILTYNFGTNEYTVARSLASSISKDLRVGVHQFYKGRETDESSGFKVWSTHPPFQTFIESGPADCIHKSTKQYSQRTTPRPKSRTDPASATARRFVSNKQGLGSCVNGSTRNLTNKLPSLLSTYVPSTSIDRFRWVHVPCLHVGWVWQVLAAISREQGNPALYQALLSNQTWLPQHSPSEPSVRSGSFVKSSAKYSLSNRVPISHVQGTMAPGTSSGGTQFAICLSYLHWDTFKQMQKRSLLVAKRKQQPDLCPVDPEIVSGKSMEAKLIWQYCCSKRPVYCRRTLDEYGYPNLRTTSLRNADQTLYKRTKTGMAFLEYPATPGNLLGKVLMVDQLWILILDDQTVVTFANPKEEASDDDCSKQGDLYDNILHDVNGDYAAQCADPLDFAALAVLHAVRALLETTSDVSLQVFRIFDEYYSLLTERQTVSFKEFRNTYAPQHLRPSREQSPRKHAGARQELDDLLSLRDMEDELNIMSRLFREQQRVVTDMIRRYKDLNARQNQGLHGTRFLHEAECSIRDYQEQVDTMLRNGKAVQDALKDLFIMKEQQDNLTSREQMEVAAEQGRAVMIFTVVTIIFLPLSFFASLFGINAREWSGTPENLSLGTIFAYMLPISFVVIALALMVAFNKLTRKFAREIWQNFL